MLEFIIKIWTSPSFIVMAICLLLAIFSINEWFKEKKWKVGLIFLTPLVLLIIELIAYEMPHYWSTLSLVGKMVAIYISYLIPVLISGFLVFTLPEGWRPRIITIFTSVIGVLVLTVTPMIALLLVCFITGDCV